MIDLSQSAAASPLIHTVAADPGRRWLKDANIAVDAAPDSAAQFIASNGDVAFQAMDWRASSAERTGIFGAVSPRVIALPGGGYRMFYTQIFPRDGYPMGAVDYDQAASRIMSASSVDGLTWSPEPGVRLSPQAGGAGDYRVVSSDVVPVGSGELWRMYYECCPGTQATTNSIRSAISQDLGSTWSLEPGVRWQTDGHNYSAPRILHLDDGRCRLYCVQRGLGIISCVSSDGLNFQREPGVRLLPGSAYDRLIAFAPEI
ncbi:MAG: hypothetical protein IT423_01335, partial [Pirellulaceae bacterium]|nr:hypothetical protein [Pirellulaceae bacterium]